MAKERFPRQLDLPLDFCACQCQPEAKPSATVPTASTAPDGQSGVVVDFMSARAEREAEREATELARLYRKIIDSVRHLR